MGRRGRSLAALVLAASTVAAGAAAGEARSAPGSPPRIVKMMIPFGAARRAQTKAYALAHYGIDSYRLVDPHLIVWHFTESPTVASTYNAFASDQPDVEFHVLPNVCAHFVIGPDGTIYQLVPVTIMCRHVVGLNYTAIGIENVGFSDRQVLDDAAQLRAALALTHYLRCRFHIPPQNVIGHNESLASPYYRERVAAFRGQTHGDFVTADMVHVRAMVSASPCT